MKLLAMIVVLFLVLVPAATWSAELEAHDGYILLKGEIAAGDHENLVKELKRTGAWTLHLDSPGGDTYEAMKIGRLVRSALLQAMPYGKCWSACALILLGDGVEWVRLANRMFTLDIAFHRAYLLPEINRKLGLDESQKAHRKISTDVKSYLNEMEVDTWVIEKILGQSSQETWIPTHQEVEQVFKKWSGLEEWLNAKCGSMSDSEDNDLQLMGTAEDLISGKLTPPQAAVAAHFAWSVGGPDWKAKFNSFTPGYKAYLKEKSTKIFPCRYRRCPIRC